MGQRMIISFDAKNFSSSSGTLSTRIDTPNGWLDGRVGGWKNMLHVTKRHPVKAQLKITRPFRESRILMLNCSPLEKPPRRVVG